MNERYSKKDTKNVSIGADEAMPYAAEVERNVIGGLISEGKNYNLFSHLLHEGLFYTPECKLVFEAIEKLHKKGAPIDELAVTEELNKVKTNYDNIPLLVTRLVREVGYNDHINYHIEILQNYAEKRRGIEISRKLTSAAHGQNESAFNDAISELRDWVNYRSVSSKMADILKDPTHDEFLDIMKQSALGIAVDYEFINANNEKKRLVIPGGALSFFCAPTSHGKSTFLRNLAMQMATKQDNEDERGNVLYFTFEESRQDLWAQLLNLRLGEDLHMPTKNYNNINSIKRYFYNKDTSHWSDGAKEKLIDAINDFENNIIIENENGNRGHLKVVNKDIDVSELVETVSFYYQSMKAHGKKVKAVFIDYIQLMTVEGKSNSKKEEVAEVCKELMHLSVRLGIPFVCAAQLSREAKSPSLLYNQYISDASDIEKCANLIVCLWDSSQEAQDPKYYENNKDEKRLIDRGFFAGGKKRYEGNSTFDRMPYEKTIYAKITKYRGSEVGLDAVLKWNKNTGKIYSNLSEDEELIPKQTEILICD